MVWGLTDYGEVAGSGGFEALGTRFPFAYSPPVALPRYNEGSARAGE
jgi:hypothetical protein